MEQYHERLKSVKRIVIKVGSSTLTHDNGKMNLKRIDDIAFTISDLANQGIEVILVSSGSIAVGVEKMRLSEKPENIPEKQAAAAVGQCELMSMYSNLFSRYGQTVAQILVTRDAFDKEISLRNVTNTFESLLKKNIIPIVNENDTVSIEELEYVNKFGDNDTLSAHIANICKADMLVILTDMDGMYDDDPRENPNAKIINVVDVIDEKIENFAKGEGTSRGTGGFFTKIKAARMVNKNGIDMVIMNGARPYKINKILEGKKEGTLFVAK